jgi:murein DD-endopeptidase MepM/ murein hydrolase activator NlpD
MDAAMPFNSHANRAVAGQLSVDSPARLCDLCRAMGLVNAFLPWAGGDHGRYQTAQRRVRLPQHLAAALAIGLGVWLFAPTAEAPEARAEIAPPAPVFVAPPMPVLAAPPTTRLLRLAAGDTLNDVLHGAGLAARDAQAVIAALAPVFPPRALKPGQEIALDFTGVELGELRLTTGVDRDIVVTRTADGSFTAHPRLRKLAHVPELAAGVIRTSLFEAAGEAGVPMPVLNEMIHEFSYDVDFQRDLHPDDSFEVLYERLYDERGKAVGIGDIAYAAMTLSGKTLKLYRYLPAGAKTAEYLTPAGANVKKALLRTPVDGARLSSGFGLRLHPILGYTKMHRGVDFAAPPGSPIMAAGDGVVESAGAAGAYGNLVVVRHDGAYETAYAHMSHIARGVKPGTMVRQGQVIGYVGATGRATGPHLHYEVRFHGEPMNPMSVKTGPGLPLAKGESARFEAATQATDRTLLALRQATVIASAPQARMAQ